MTRSYESNGPDVRVRGNAAHVAEKYVQLARDANSSGDSVAAENYLQHAEHYFRIISAAQAQQQAQASRSEQRQQENRGEKAAEAQSGMGSGDDESAQQEEKTDPKENGAGLRQETAGDFDKEQSRPKRLARERRPRRRPVGEKALAAGGSKDESNPADVVAVPADTVPVDATEPMNDPANAPQPDVGELPAFVSAEGDGSAAK